MALGRTKGGQKGSANAANSALAAPFKSALNRSIAQNPKKIMAATMALLDAAANGDLAAIKELADRTDGKSVQQIVGAGGGPLRAEISWKE